MTRMTRRQLLKAAGLGVAATGGIPLLATGASRRVTGFTMPLLITGTGIFLGSWVAGRLNPQTDPVQTNLARIDQLGRTSR